MTIKEFARLCGCNPQTLRYYDHVNLLKPVKVDPWSGYRFYEEEQALAFVKIKNLQRAGFTIERIKGLLDQDNRVIFEAFEARIAEEEQRLREIRNIQQSYQSEMSDMQKKLEAVRKLVKESMDAYDPTEEFGIDRETYTRLTDIVNSFFESMLDGGENRDPAYDYSDYPDGDDAEEETDFLDFLNNPEYEPVYEKHGWKHVRDFFAECPALEAGQEYALLFKLEQGKAQPAFCNTVLGLLLLANPDKKKKLSCNVTPSEDGENHFWLLKRK